MLSGTIQVGLATVLGGVMFRDAQHGWAVGGLSQVVATSDGGAHWSRPTLSCGAHACFYAVYAAAFPDSQSGWIVGEDMFRTADGGQTWAHYDTPIAGGIEDIQFIDQSTGWLATDRGEIWYTGNHGARWHELASGTGFALKGLHFVDAQHGWFVGGGGTILSYAAARLPITDELFLPIMRR